MQETDQLRIGNNTLKDIFGTYFDMSFTQELKVGHRDVLELPVICTKAQICLPSSPLRCRWLRFSRPMGGERWTGPTNRRPGSGGSRGESEHGERGEGGEGRGEGGLDVILGLVRGGRRRVWGGKNSVESKCVAPKVFLVLESYNNIYEIC